MEIYVDANSETPIQDAILALEAKGYQETADSRLFFYQQEDEGSENIMQVYCDDENGDNTIYWSFSHVSDTVTPANTRAVYFTC